MTACIEGGIRSLSFIIGKKKYNINNHYHFFHLVAVRANKPTLFLCLFVFCILPQSNWYLFISFQVFKSNEKLVIFTCFCKFMNCKTMVSTSLVSNQPFAFQGFHEVLNLTLSIITYPCSVNHIDSAYAQGFSTGTPLILFQNHTLLVSQNFPLITVIAI